MRGRFAWLALILLTIAQLGHAQLGYAQPGHAEPAIGACAYLASLIPRGDGPLFLPSYPTADPGPLRGVAFLYDNAVAAVALTGCGEAARARRIGDAIVFALDHDRAWHDGRLRNAYAAGPVQTAPIKLAGWWDTKQSRWLEDAYQVSSDTGNMAWAILALLALDKAVGDHRYRDAALRVSVWTAARADDRGLGGYGGGYSGWEPNPVPTLWKSTEHNTDVAAAFALLAQATGDGAWMDRAARARQFVRPMWDEKRGCYMVGVTEDGVTPNRVIAIDAEIWPLLAVPGEAAAHGDTILATIGRTLKAGDGYSYSDSGHELWTEGTAQAALAFGLMGRNDTAASLGAAIAGQKAPVGGFYATPASALGTGFADPTNPATERFYYHLPHLAAAGWAALAETRFNPFTLGATLP